MFEVPAKGSKPVAANSPEPPLRSLRQTLLAKLDGSCKAWSRSVSRFRALYWICLTGIIVLPTCLATLKSYIEPVPTAILSVLVAVLGSVQAIVKPYDKFNRDIEFRDEADYFRRQAEATDDPDQIKKIMEEFENVERRFHQGLHPWPVLKSNPADGSAHPDAQRGPERTSHASHRTI